MALTVETGANVPGADSLVSLADARAYAALRGLSLDADDTAAEVQLRKAMDHMTGLEAQFQGFRASSTQSLPFPRYDMEINGYQVASDTVPQQAIHAQVMLAAEVAAGADLSNREQAGIATEKTIVGAVSVKYAANGAKTYKARASDALMAALMSSSGGQVRLVRG